MYLEIYQSISFLSDLLLLLRGLFLFVDVLFVFLFILLLIFYCFIQMHEIHSIFYDICNFLTHVECTFVVRGASIDCFCVSASSSSPKSKHGMILSFKLLALLRLLSNSLRHLRTHGLQIIDLLAIVRCF